MPIYSSSLCPILNSPVAIVCLVACLGLTPLAGSARAGELSTPSSTLLHQQAAPVVTVASVVTGTITDTVTATGSFSARERVLVRAETDNLMVREVLAEEGDFVRRGQLLVKLARESLEIQLTQNSAALAKADAAIEQAKAQIAEGQAGLERASSSLNRARTLNGSGNTSQDILEQREADARVATARLASARQGLKLAEADLEAIKAQRADLLLKLEHTEVRAPADGLVTRRDVRIGDLPSGAAGALFELAAHGEIEVEAQVSENSLPRIKAGQRVMIRATEQTAARSGRVRLVAREISPTSRLGHVRVTLDPPEPAAAERPASDGGAPASSAGAMALGTFALCDIQISQRTGLVIPSSSIQQEGAGSTVQVVRDGRVETRCVLIGLRNPQQSEILDGLSAGENVITRAGTFVRDGDPVIASTVTEPGDAAMTANPKLHD